MDDLDVCPTAAALQRERDWEVNEPIASCPGLMGGGLVDELYESHPYPSWRRFGSRNAAAAGRTKIRRSLIAGAGTGKAVLAHLEHYAPQEILAVDFSKRSLQMAKRQLLALAVTNVTFLHCDLTMLDGTLGTFDVIESIGVLHHLIDPSIGFAVLKRLLAPKGILVLGLYSRVARRSLPVMRQLAAAHSKEQFRDWLVQGAKIRWRCRFMELRCDV